MKKTISCILLTIFCISTCFANIKLQANNFKPIVKWATKLGHKYGNNKVLLVFDLDNTLLVTNHYLGSVPWWSWQEHMLNTNPQAKQLTARSFSKLLRVQNILFNIVNMHLTDPHIAKDLSDLQQAGFKTIILSLRNYFFRDVTAYQLYRNHLNFTTNAIGPIKGYPGSYMPYKNGRFISYMNGILLAGGQNKGMILQSLLKKTHYQPKAIIFVDDLAKNVNDIYTRFKYSGIETVTIRYSREDGFVKKFNKQAKAKVSMQWERLNALRQELK